MATTTHELPMRSRGGHWPGVVAAALTTTVAVMPGFTVGGLAPAIEEDLHLSRTAVGMMISAFYAASAAGSPIAKRAAASLPTPVVLAAAAVVACAAMVAFSQAGGPVTMTVVLVAGGLSNGLVQPAAGRLITARVPGHRRSLAASAVGAALGAGALVPGLLVALIVPAYGWRTAMLIAGLIALIPASVTPLTRLPFGTSAERAEGKAATRGTGGVLVLWAVAAALAATSNNAVATYFVQLGTHSGLPTTITGNLLSLCALLAIGVRLAAGALTDRAPGGNPAVITAMMLTGGLGLVLVAVGTPATFLLGAVLAFSAGWGWTGLLLATTLRLVAGKAENAGHTVQIGVYTGATVAPYTFAVLDKAFGFAGAALITATGAFAAAGVMIVGTLLFRRIKDGSTRRPLRTRP